MTQGLKDSVLGASRSFGPLSFCPSSLGHGGDGVGVPAQHGTAQAVPDPGTVLGGEDDVRLPQDAEVLGHRRLGQDAALHDLGGRVGTAFDELLDDPDPSRVGETFGDLGDPLFIERSRVDEAVLAARRRMWLFHGTLSSSTIIDIQSCLDEGR